MSFQKQCECFRAECDLKPAVKEETGKVAGLLTFIVPSGSFRNGN